MKKLFAAVVFAAFLTAPGCEKKVPESGKAMEGVEPQDSGMSKGAGPPPSLGGGGKEVQTGGRSIPGKKP